MKKTDLKDVGLSIFIHECLSCNIRNDLGINNYNIKSLAIKIENERSKNVILGTIYRQPNGNLNASENYCNDFFSKNEKIIIKNDYL